MRPILLADDCTDDAVIIQSILKKAGVLNPVIVVSDGERAISFLKKEGINPDRERFALPSVILLDLQMPKVDGFQVLEWWKKQPHFQNMLVVVLSGRHDLESINRAYALGAHSFLVKPCKVEDIVNLTETFKGYWHQPPPVPR